MWNALRADFQEFVSTVADDTSNVLSKLDAGMEKGEGDDDNEENENDNEENEDNDSDQKPEVNYAELKEIMTLLRDHPGTYLEDLADEDDTQQVEEYLKEFAIDAKTEAIAQVLEEHTEVKKHFEELCPTQVTYEDFWKRYFYRCNHDRIARQLQEETERARQARAEAIRGGIDTVTNFFGGALKTVTNTIAPEAGAGDGDTPNADNNNNNINNKGGGLNFFGAKGRPPFVMNTAVDESGDDDDVGDDDEEEELGWDDDDEDDDGDEGEEADTTTEQIEFTDKVAEDLKEQLKQAIAERDSIQQTVHLQAAEIKSLQTKLSGGEGGVSTDSTELEDLKLKLFEKDAELAALKARLHDDDLEDGKTDTVASLIRALQKLPSDELSKIEAEIFGAVEPKGDDSGSDAKISALEQKVEQLQKELAAKDASLVECTEKLELSIQELETARSQLSNDQANAQNASAAVIELESQLKSAQANINSLQTENESLKEAARQTQTESTTQLSSLKQEIADSQQTILSLTAQVEELQINLQEKEDSLKQKEAALAAAKQTTATPSTPDSYSTGVKVDTPVFTTPLTSAAASNDVGEEGVGDDWGDDWD